MLLVEMFHQVPAKQATIFLTRVFDSYKADKGLLATLFAEFVGSQAHVIQTELLKAQHDIVFRRQVIVRLGCNGCNVIQSYSQLSPTSSSAGRLYRSR